MDLMPILSTLRRHKTAALLIVFEIALTCTIVCNALHLISRRITTLNTDIGIPESELLVVDLRGANKVENADAATQRDLAALRALPGIKAALVINQVPYHDNNNYSGVSLSNDEKAPRIDTSQYEATEGMIKALDLKLVEGRDFEPQEMLNDSQFTGGGEGPAIPAIIITRTLAERLFPGQSAVGKQVYVYGDKPQTVVGVLERLSPPSPSRHAGDGNLAMILPLRPAWNTGNYLLRVEPGQRDAMLKKIVATLEPLDSNRVVTTQRHLSDMRNDYYRQDRMMAWLLGGVCLALLVITALGIIGLASFWVQQRTRMIGTRRALGATRHQILRYFQAENFLLSSAGIVLGIGGALGLSAVLMRNAEIAALPWSYLPAGALMLYLLGQLAVLAPARRAAALPPVAALRGQ
ncbi:FtsX-like permease family protein [Pelomonas sp. SE-A7]|uniref:ABC transporter permease n=1 Tax=Pelomonas sp. SE-A7 TaxID=3054953 RepID=UPI00259D1E1A|nr:FtsX-like permease family protein [Pelomonas sp. SE-A7]MDM4768031.1 ABC transporter permease [Pelomonas sp. SE-A7]